VDSQLCSRSYLLLFRVGGAGRRVVQKEKSSQAILAPNNNFKDIEDDVVVPRTITQSVDGIYGM
jgi:hypothetical protein